MHNYIAFTQICVLKELREKKQKSKKKQQIRLKMRASIDLDMARSSHYRDKAKNCRNKEMSKRPEDCRNNRFTIATKNWQNSFVNKRKLSRHFTVCRNTILGKYN